MAARGPLVLHYRRDKQGPHIVKCKCGSYLSLTPEGLDCPCGRRHRVDDLLPDAREKTIVGEKEESEKG